MEMEIVATIVSLLGSYLVAVKKREGFMLFLVANTGWIVFDIANGHYGQMVMFCLYCYTAILGYKNFK